MERETNTKQYAFMVLKPDALRQALDNHIIQGLEDRGFQIPKRKLVIFTLEEAKKLYIEKSHYIYFPLLLKFMTEGQSLCLVLKTTGEQDATLEAKKYRNLVRSNLKLEKYDLTPWDLELLNWGTHPKQREITRVMALENLVHVSDEFSSQGFVRQLFTKNEICELIEREPLLYSFLTDPIEVQMINHERGLINARHG